MQTTGVHLHTAPQLKSIALRHEVLQDTSVDRLSPEKRRSTAKGSAKNYKTLPRDRQKSRRRLLAHLELYSSLKGATLLVVRDGVRLGHLQNGSLVLYSIKQALPESPLHQIDVSAANIDEYCRHQLC